MKRNQTIATVLMAACLVFGMAACGEEEEGSSIDCETDRHIEVGEGTCDFTAAQVECLYGVVVDDGYELEVVICEGESSTCEAAIIVATLDGEPVDGEVGLYDGSQDYEIEGDVDLDSWEFEKTDERLSLSFSGTIDGSSIEIAGCVNDLEWSEDDFEDDDDDAPCTSDNGEGQFYCEEITDEDVCAYIGTLCEAEESDDCCEWDEDAGNCGADAEDFDCEMITDEDVCNNISDECYWDEDEDA